MKKQVGIKQLFVAQPGRYSHLHPCLLTCEGRRQMEELCSAIKDALGDKTAHIISYNANVMTEIADLMRSQLGTVLGIEIHSGLFREIDGEIVFPFINERSDMADSLITFLSPYSTYSLSGYLVRREFGTDADLTCFNGGNAVHFDFEQRAYQIIPK